MGWARMSTALPIAPAPPAATATSVGFKDWALICSALSSGRQSIILRKGGIAEGRAGFRFKHEDFFLFPTQYHQQAERVRPEEVAALDRAPAAPDGTVGIRLRFVLEFAHWIDDWERLRALDPFHVWKEEIIRERFEYDEARGIQCAFGRVLASNALWTFPDHPSYGGCRSWVNLPAVPSSLEWTPVLPEEEHQRRARMIETIINDHK